MTTDQNSNDREAPHSKLELTAGKTSVSIEGSEDFIERQLPDLLSWVGNNSQSQSEHSSGDQEDQKKGGKEELVQDQLPVPADASEGGSESSSDVTDSEIKQIAQNINVDPEKLSEHFYVDSDGIHIQNPMKIDPECALLGYCTLREQITGETYHDNRETKQTLIDQEKVNISNWGSSLLYQLRRNGLIKDDPNTDRKRNKPFKVTPKGHQEFVNWVNEQE